MTYDVSFAASSAIPILCPTEYNLLFYVSFNVISIEILIKSLKNWN